MPFVMLSPTAAASNQRYAQVPPQPTGTESSLQRSPLQLTGSQIQPATVRRSGKRGRVTVARGGGTCGAQGDDAAISTTASVAESAAHVSPGGEHWCRTSCRGEDDTQESRAGSDSPDAHDVVLVESWDRLSARPGQYGVGISPHVRGSRTRVDPQVTSSPGRRKSAGRRPAEPLKGLSGGHPSRPTLADMVHRFRYGPAKARSDRVARAGPHSLQPASPLPVERARSSEINLDSTNDDGSLVCTDDTAAGYVDRAPSMAVARDTDVLEQYRLERCQAETIVRQVPAVSASTNSRHPSHPVQSASMEALDEAAGVVLSRIQGADTASAAVDAAADATMDTVSFATWARGNIPTHQLPTTAGSVDSAGVDVLQEWRRQRDQVDALQERVLATSHRCTSSRECGSDLHLVSNGGTEAVEAVLLGVRGMLPVSPPPPPPPPPPSSWSSSLSSSSSSHKACSLVRPQAGSLSSCSSSGGGGGGGGGGSTVCSQQASCASSVQPTTAQYHQSSFARDTWGTSADKELLVPTNSRRQESTGHDVVLAPQVATTAPTQLNVSCPAAPIAVATANSSTTGVVVVASNHETTQFEGSTTVDTIILNSVRNGLFSAFDPFATLSARKLQEGSHSSTLKARADVNPAKPLGSRYRVLNVPQVTKTACPGPPQSKAGAIADHGLSNTRGAAVAVATTANAHASTVPSTDVHYLSATLEQSLTESLADMRSFENDRFCRSALDGKYAAVAQCADELVSSQGIRAAVEADHIVQMLRSRMLQFEQMLQEFQKK